MGLFLLVYVVLKKMLFAPYLRLQDVRGEAAAPVEAAGDQGLAADVARLEEAQRSLGRQIGDLRSQQLAAAKREASRVVDAAQGRAVEALAVAAADLDTTFAAVASELSAQRAAMVAQIVTRLTGGRR